MHIRSGDGYGQQAFFFVNGRYIGTDASRPSATLRVVSQGDTEVTLAYPLYRNGNRCAARAAGRRGSASSSTTANSRRLTRSRRLAPGPDLSRY